MKTAVISPDSIKLICRCGNESFNLNDDRNWELHCVHCGQVYYAQKWYEERKE